MQEPTTHSCSPRNALAPIGALALVAALMAAGCVTLDDADVLDDGVVTSDLSAGDTALYKCAFPMCGGAGIKFDSRNLALQACAYDPDANVLDCEASAADSPKMPSAFWDSSAAQLWCSDGAQFSCSGKGELQCACSSSTSTSSSNPASVTYGPVITVKPKG